MIRTLIVDDEEPARRLLRFRLEEEPDIEIVGEAADGQTALRMIKEDRPELVFLDIQMPGLSGLDLLDQLPVDERPHVVFVTAYDDFAVRAFEKHALDYLLKPITLERWKDTLARVRESLTRDEIGARHAELLRILQAGQGPTGQSTSALSQESVPKADGRLTAQSGDRLVLLRLDEIQQIEAARNYVRLVTIRGTFLRRATLAATLAQLPSEFAQVHRSTIVNLNLVADIRREWHGDYVISMNDGSDVRMSRRYAGQVIRP